MEGTYIDLVCANEGHHEIATLICYYALKNCDKKEEIEVIEEVWSGREHRSAVNYFYNDISHLCIHMFIAGAFYGVTLFYFGHPYFAREGELTGF